MLKSINNIAHNKDNYYFYNEMIKLFKNTYDSFESNNEKIYYTVSDILKPMMLDYIRYEFIDEDLDPEFNTIVNENFWDMV